MRNTFLRLFVFLPVIAIITSGCNQPAASESAAQQQQGQPKSVGELTELMGYEPISVEGVGLVAGLAGTGSSECPPKIRAYLKQYILSQLPKNSPMTADELINSKDTAVVKLEGTIPPGARKNEAFDLRVSVWPGTQTTSLAGGRLYTCELMLVNAARKLATGQGPVYIDMIESNDVKTGYVIGGGASKDEYNLNFALLAPDFRLANAIRNKINERFGDNTAAAPSQGLVTVVIPQQYAKQKAKLISLIRAMYLGENEKQQAQRVGRLLDELGVESKADSAENQLEAIGRMEEERLIPLLQSEKQDVRFRAARLLLSFGNDSGLGILREMALKSDNPKRLEAMQAIGTYAKRNDARAIIKPLVEELDLKVKIGAYEELKKLQDPAVTSTNIAGDFELDQVRLPGYGFIYVYRSGQPRIVLFGSPIQTSTDIFAQSADESLILNSTPDKKAVSVVRKNPQGGLIGPAQSPNDLYQMIVRSCEEPPKPEIRVLRYGLGASYSAIVSVLKNMTDNQTVKAAFKAGELPKIKTMPAKAPTTNTNVKETTVNSK